jgi:hypothetical protein
MTKFRWLLFWLIIGLVPACEAQYGAINGYCNEGGNKAFVSGLQSTNYLQGIVPSCTVTVYLTGTETLATIYSNSTGTSLPNPFTANSAFSSNAGGWKFFALAGKGYDIVLSGGIFPNNYISPVTISDVNPSSVFYHVNPSMGDPITSIQAAWTACGNACIVVMDPGTYTSTSSTPLLMSYPTQSLEGDGKNMVTINYSGANFLNVQEGTFTLSSGPKISGFTLNCTAANSTCMNIGSAIELDISDVTVAGPGGLQSTGANSGTCIQFQNNNGWFERWSLDAQIGGCSSSVTFATPTGSGTTSYGYGKMSLIGSPVGTAILVQPTALLYHMRGLTVQYNSNGLQASTTASASSGASSITVTSASGILPGQAIIAAGIPSGDVVAQSYTIGSTTVPLTAATTAALSATAISFYTVMLESAGTISGGNFNIVGESSYNYALGEVLSGGIVNLCGSAITYAAGFVGVAAPITSGNNGNVPWSLRYCQSNLSNAVATGVGNINNFSGDPAVIAPMDVPQTANARTSSGYLVDLSNAHVDPYVSIDTTDGGAWCVEGVPSFSYTGNMAPLNCIDSGGNMNVGAGAGIKTSSGGGFTGDAVGGWNAWMESGATYGYRFWNGLPEVGPLIAQLTSAGNLSVLGNVAPGNGTNVVYRCTVAGTIIPVGTLTIVASDCGTSGATDTGLRVK